MCENANLDLLLAQVQMSQHSVRTIKATLEDYPSLQKELRRCIDQGVTKMAIAMFKGDKPKIQRKNEYAMLYINDK